jgi:hypothetical protein
MKLIDLLNEYKINRPNSNYKLVLDIVKSYEDEDIMADFLKTFPEGKNISKDEFFEFFTSYVDDTSEYYYIKQNWKYVESGGDESVYDEEEEDDDEDEELDEYQINKPGSRPPALIEVVKDIYLCTDRTREDEYYAKDEIFDNFAHLFVVGDIWELKKDEDDEYYYECIKGQWKEDISEGWWEYNDTTKDFFKILKR